jgi:hypothetical protein
MTALRISPCAESTIICTISLVGWVAPLGFVEGKKCFVSRLVSALMRRVGAIGLNLKEKGDVRWETGREIGGALDLGEIR